MDPSYNNGVGTQVPQNNPQMSGQPVQQSVAPQQPVMASQQPAMMQQPIISSGGGEDVMLGGGMSEQKSRKGVVALIVLVVLLGLVGGGFLLWQNGVFGGGSGGDQQTVGLKEAYNSYVNYVLWGVESDGQPNLEAIEGVVGPYFEGLEGDVLDAYIVNANNKYEALKQNYDAVEGEEKEDLTVLYSYFESYPKIVQISTEEIIKMYVDGGVDVTKKVIEANYSGSDNEQYFDDYLTAEKNFAETYLNLVKGADAKGCVEDGVMIQGCYQLNDEQKNLLGEQMSAVANTRSDLVARATSVIKTLYVGLYGEEVTE
ncbi:hypothetical protein IJH01_03120 [Candidatus Saccharibacteria bacterium]|nr:hypothetical protein [Candidatus Saccharibacteria bacterium]